MLRATLLLCLPLLASAADPTGKWTLRIIRFGEESFGGNLELTASGPKLTGTLNELKLEGKIDGDRLQFTGFRPNGKECCRFEGRLQDVGIAGAFKDGAEEFEWKATRTPVISASPK